MFKRLIIFTYLAFSRGSSEFEQFPGIDPNLSPIENNEDLNPAPMTTNNDITIEKSPPNDSTVTTSPPNDTTVANSSPNDTTVIDSPPNDVTVDDSPPNDTTVVNSSPNYTTVTDSLPNDTTVDESPPNDTTVANSPPNDTAEEMSTTDIIDKMTSWETGPLVAKNHKCSGENCPNKHDISTTQKPFNAEFKRPRPRAQMHSNQHVVYLGCPAERPAHIGPFTVPTQQALIQTIQILLNKAFSSYKRKTNSFLEDVEKASRSMIEYENYCTKKVEYRDCTERVTSATKMLTSSVLNSMDNMMRDIDVMYKNLTCNISDTETIDDPMKLIKFIASEEASMGFAMPGFLRLLYTCFRFCVSHSEGMSVGSYSLPENLIRIIQPQTPIDTIRSSFHTEKSFKYIGQHSSRPRYMNLGRMINLKGKPILGLKYLNSDRLSYTSNK